MFQGEFMPNSDLNFSVEGSLNSLKESLRNAHDLSASRVGEMSEHSIDFLLSAIFIRICTTARTISMMAPKDNSIESIWDYASLGTLLRNIMDALNSFLYLADKSLSKEDKDCRFWLFSLHDAVTRQKIFEFRGSQKESASCKTRAEGMRDLLRKNSTFMSLDGKKQKHYLKGTDAFLLSKEQVVEANGGNREDFLGLYKFLSANAHSYPMGFFKMGEQEFGRGIYSEIEEEYTIMILSLTSSNLDSLCIAYEQYLQ
tara:strand:+ start:311 stop:1081 length:771 start_codon:yes stop_codon:yes gene_type:complete